MGDARLRELERRARTGDPQAEAEQLLARVRSGTLSRERLELAAYCGHEGALAVAPPDPISLAWISAPSLDRWLEGLTGWPWREVLLVRAARAASGLATEHALAPLRGSGLMHFTPALRVEGACDEWLIQPTDERFGAWEAVWRSVEGHPWPWLPEPSTSLVPGLGCAQRTIGAAARAVTGWGVRRRIERALTAWALGGSP